MALSFESSTVQKYCSRRCSFTNLAMFIMSVCLARALSTGNNVMMRSMSASSQYFVMEMILR